MSTLDVMALGKRVSAVESIALVPRVGSTLDLLSRVVKECAENDFVCPPTVMLADEQMAGKGREGRPWSSPPGGLYAALSFSTTEKRAPAMPFEIGLLAARVAEGAGASPKLKWPNDLQLAGRKLGGVLIRGRHGEQGVQVVAGVGINVAPVENEPDSASLAEVADGLTLEKVQESFVIEFDSMLSNPSELNELLEEWRTRSAHREGDHVTFVSGGERFSGTWLGIDDQGRARIESDGSEREISSGEIVEWQPQVEQ